MNCSRRVGNLLFDVVEEMLMVKLQSGTPKLFPIPTSAHSYCLVVPKVPCSVVPPQRTRASLNPFLTRYKAITNQLQCHHKRHHKE